MSRTFGLILKTREKLYRSGVFRTLKLGHPVISVGNLTLGGTGKTPFVIALAERLRDDGFRPVVLSRGYKRTTTDVRIVSRGEGPIIGWDEAGDEPFLIARRVHGIAVVVGANRYEAGRLAEREGLGNIFILDDGFQHRRLARDFDLIAIDPVEWAAGEELLPTGPWREPKTAIERAHAACIQEDARTPFPSLPIPTFRVATQIDGIYQGVQPLSLDQMRGRPVVAFAGIAKPERFFATLEGLGIEISERVRFRDHHLYTNRDLDTLTAGARITTEKDAVRLEGAGFGEVAHVRISLKIPEFDRLIELIHNRLPL